MSRRSPPRRPCGDWRRALWFKKVPLMLTVTGGKKMLRFEDAEERYPLLKPCRNFDKPNYFDYRTDIERYVLFACVLPCTVVCVPALINIFNPWGQLFIGLVGAWALLPGSWLCRRKRRQVWEEYVRAVQNVVVLDAIAGGADNWDHWSRLPPPKQFFPDRAKWPGAPYPLFESE